MAKRYCGDLTINVVYRDDGLYHGNVSNGSDSWRFDDIGAPAVCFGPGVAYDSPEAYDDTARAAIAFAPYDLTEGVEYNAEGTRFAIRRKR